MNLMRSSKSRHTRPAAALTAAFLLAVIAVPLVAAMPAYDRQPIHIESDSAELDQIEGRSIYRGNVRLTQGEAVIHGDEITVIRPQPGGPMEITITGDPATYHEPRTEPDPPVDARASRMQYDTGNQILHLSGNARVARGNDVLRGDDIRYSRREARIIASGGAEEGGRVQIIITPRNNDGNEP